MPAGGAGLAGSARLGDGIGCGAAAAAGGTGWGAAAVIFPGIGSPPGSACAMTNAASPIRNQPVGGPIHPARRAAAPARSAIRSTREGGRAGASLCGGASPRGGASLSSGASPCHSHKPGSWLSSLIGAAPGDDGCEAVVGSGDTGAGTTSQSNVETQRACRSGPRARDLRSGGAGTACGSLSWCLPCQSTATLVTD